MKMTKRKEDHVSGHQQHDHGKASKRKDTIGNKQRSRSFDPYEHSSKHLLINDGFELPNLKVKTILFSGFVLLNFGLFAQSNWGFAAAALQVSTGDTLSDYFFVSKVKNLSKLSKLRTAGTDASRRKSVYSVSLRDWFYSSLRNSRFGAIEDIHREDILAEIQLHSDLGDRYMVTPPDEKHPIFMSRKMASKKRRQFIELAQTNGDRIIVIN